MKKNFFHIVGIEAYELADGFVVISENGGENIEYVLDSMDEMIEKIIDVAYFYLDEILDRGVTHEEFETTLVNFIKEVEGEHERKEGYFYSYESQTAKCLSSYSLNPKDEESYQIAIYGLDNSYIIVGDYLNTTFYSVVKSKKQALELVIDELYLLVADYNNNSNEPIDAETIEKILKEIKVEFKHL